MTQTHLNSLQQGATSNQPWIPGEDAKRAPASVRAFHKKYVRSTNEKLEIQRQCFELAKAREVRHAAKSQRSETDVANKEDSEIRFAKNAVSSPQKKRA